MILSMIAAMDNNRVIGKDNSIPWNLPCEQLYFRNITMGHPVIMGRKSFESIGKPLEGRRNIILTKDSNYSAKGCEIIHSVEEALELFSKSSEEVFVIGGQEIYRQFLPYANRLYITIIDNEFNGNKYFPEININEWKIVSFNKGINDESSYSYCHFVYERI